ncbi:MAG TPA: hypothetical protein VNP72_08490, partial [Longimicrobium sp.]|nr:hypothetical protein [Longimicrobium sp.]
MSDFRTRENEGARYGAVPYAPADPHPTPAVRPAHAPSPVPAARQGMEELLRILCDLPGPTGQEDAVLDWVEREWAGRGEVTRTAVGNLYLHLPGPGPRVLMAAHADELSLIVRSVTEDGFLRVLPGERDVFAFPYFIGQRFRILAESGPLPGVLAATTGHALTPEQKERSKLTWDDLFVDVGLTA